MLSRVDGCLCLLWRDLPDAVAFNWLRFGLGRRPVRLDDCAAAGVWRRLLVAARVHYGPDRHHGWHCGPAPAKFNGPSTARVIWRSQKDVRFTGLLVDYVITLPQIKLLL